VGGGCCVNSLQLRTCRRSGLGSDVLRRSRTSSLPPRGAASWDAYWNFLPAFPGATVWVYHNGFCAAAAETLAHVARLSTPASNVIGRGTAMEIRAVVTQSSPTWPFRHHGVLTRYRALTTSVIPTVRRSLLPGQRSRCAAGEGPSWGTCPPPLLASSPRPSGSVNASPRPPTARSISE
jgi:hypothetical protein